MQLASYILAIFIGLFSVSSLSVAADAASNDYRLGSGDQVRITVFQNPELLTDTRVSESGVLTFPLVGNVKVGGKTIQEAEKEIADGLKKGKFVIDPQVNIQLVNIYGNQVTVLGAVNRPGRVPMTNFEMHLTDALATAGGVTPGAGAGAVSVYGTRDGKPFEKNVDIATLMSEKKRNDDILLKAGDVIYVNPGNQISILGAVNRPGRYGLDGLEMSLTDAIALAGGAMPQGSDVAVVSGVRNGKQFKKQVDIAALYMGNNATLESASVQAGDVIYVHRAPVFYIYGEAQKPGAYRIEPNMTVMQALAAGGGPTPRGTQRCLKLTRKNAAGASENLSPKLTDLMQADDVLYVRESWF